MRESTQVPPLSDILRTAAGLGVDVQPDALPDSAAFLYQTIYDSLVPDLYLNHEQRRRVALDATILLCATHDSERLVPTNVDLLGGTLTECFAAYGLPVERRVPHTLRVLAISTGTRGGVVVPTLKDLANQMRNEQIRRDHNDGADYGAIARRHRLTTRRIRQILDPARNGARLAEAQAPQDRNAPGRRAEAIP